MSGLSAQQAADYWRDGFLSPLRALSADQADAYRVKLELFEHELGGRVTSGDVDEKFRIDCTLCIHGRMSWRPFRVCST